MLKDTLWFFPQRLPDTQVDLTSAEMTFFKDWELWEKMVFVRTNLGTIAFVLISFPRLTESVEQVLACLIVSERLSLRTISGILTLTQVVVLIYGTGVQIRNRRKLKKLRREGGLQQSRPRHRNAGADHDIPFGSRALESGIEIEGIWISKPNTPVPSPHQGATPAGSRPASPARGLTSNSSPGIALTQPESSSQQPSSSKATQPDNPQSPSSLSLAPSNDRSPAQSTPSMSESYSRQIDSLGLERPKVVLMKSLQGYFQPGTNLHIFESGKVGVIGPKKFHSDNQM